MLPLSWFKESAGPIRPYKLLILVGMPPHILDSSTSKNIKELERFPMARGKLEFNGLKDKITSSRTWQFTKEFIMLNS